MRTFPATLEVLAAKDAGVALRRFEDGDGVVREVEGHRKAARLVHAVFGVHYCHETEHMRVQTFSETHFTSLITIILIHHRW